MDWQLSGAGIKIPSDSLFANHNQVFDFEHNILKNCISHTKGKLAIEDLLDNNNLKQTKGLLFIKSQ